MHLHRNDHGNGGQPLYTHDPQNRGIANEWMNANYHTILSVRRHGAAATPGNYFRRVMSGWLLSLRWWVKSIYSETEPSRHI